MPHGPTETGWEGHLPDELFDLYTLECANKRDREVCGEDCSITVPRAYLAALGGPNVLAIMERWSVLSHACPDMEHPVHNLYFCSTLCLANWSAEQLKSYDADDESPSEAKQKREE